MIGRAIRFKAPPENTFREFIDAYWQECKSACPRLAVLAGKWEFEDLIPGLSDFDTRLIFSGDLSAREWDETSMAIGTLHSDMARREPRWARILEHLPGINLSIDEMVDERCYYPEFRQWTLYRGSEPCRAALAGHLAARPWSAADERYHVQRFATFYGPYQRGIDPPINIGAWEDKYALHSRFMHYFTPPLQSAVSLMLRRTVRGKLEALRLAQGLFPEPRVPELVLQAVESHYEVANLYPDEALVDLEQTLDRYLRNVWAMIAGGLSVLETSGGETPAELRVRVRQVPIAAATSFYEVFKFCRLMKGRLHFYSLNLPWFESDWLIRNELSRLRQWFYHDCFSRYALARFGCSLSADEALDRLQGELLNAEQVSGVRRFVARADPQVAPGSEKSRARELADCFDGIQRALETMWKDLLAP